MHPSTLTGVLQRLARQRLLRRTTHSGDRRRSVLVLTSRGEAINATRVGTVEACVAAALRQLGPREAASTERAIALLIEKVGDSTRRRRARRTARL